MEKYHIATSAARPLVEERESERFLQSLETFVITPSFSNAVFGALVGLGAALSLGSIQYGFFLLLLGLPCFTYGAFGWLMLQRRLNEYQPTTSWNRTEYEPTYQLSEPEDRNIAVNGNNVPVYRQPKTVEHAKRKYTFSGKQLDKLETLYLENGPAIRRDASQEGPGWSDTVGIGSSSFGIVISILEGRGYVNKPQGSKNYEWTARGVRELLDIDPPTR